MNKPFQIYQLQKIDTPKFVMSPMELKNYIDFPVKRLYFMSHPTADSGQHCHYEEKEFFVMIQGTCTAVIDKGDGREDVLMKAPTTALYVPNYVWHGFKDFSKDAILLAVSSTNYSPDRKDYLENYDEYLMIRDEKLNNA